MQSTEGRTLSWQLSVQKTADEASKDPARGKGLLESCIYAAVSQQGLSEQCASQESSLAVLWNIGIFALNFGPVIWGPILDFVGPKLTAITGAAC